MKNIFSISLIIGLLTCLSLNASAGWDEDFEILKTIPRSYEDTGAICEELARIQLSKKFPADHFNILVGVEYSDLHATIGELDIVVLDKIENKITQIGEVKCWRNFSGGLSKAKDQRSRFLNALKSQHNLYYQITSNEQDLNENLFKNVTSFITIGPKGSKQAGYDVELEYDLKELRKHGMDMLKCQDSGACAQ